MLFGYMYYMEKELKLQIRCKSITTITRFKMFVVMSGSKTYEEALIKLLDIAKVPKKEIKSI